MKELHHRRVAHLDLSPNNLYVDMDENVMVGDFGQSVHEVWDGMSGCSPWPKMFKYGTPGVCVCVCVYVCVVMCCDVL